MNNYQNEGERDFMKEINDIILNNVNIIEKYEMKLKKDKPLYDIFSNYYREQKDKQKENSIIRQKCLALPLKRVEDIIVPTEQEMKAALNLIPLKK